MKYYVYELINPIDGTPFYVGKGTGRRMFIHEYRAKKETVGIGENKKLRNKIKSIWELGEKIQYHQILFTDSNEEACNKESERIEELGLNTLCNVFIFPPTLEEIFKLKSLQMKGKKLPPKTKLKISRSLKGHIVSDATKLKISQSKTGKKNPCSELKRQRIIEAHTPVGGWPNLISPEGEQVSIHSISEFCRTYGLYTSAISELLKGKHKHHKGWKVASSQS